MIMGTSLPGLTVSAVSALMVVRFLVLGCQERDCDRTWANALFALAAIALVVGPLAFFQIVPAVVGYSLLCLALVSLYLFDLIREERTRRRRVASLTPRPSAEPIPTVWVAIAAASVLMLAPYVVLNEQRGAALMVALCACMMAGIAWRIASAPVQLAGDDIQTERMCERASRTRKAGLSAVLAIGSVFVFMSFVNADLPTTLPAQRLLLLVSFVSCAGLWAWVMLYWHLLNRRQHAAS
jgi:hypothetical protein